MTHAKYQILQIILPMQIKEIEDLCQIIEELLIYLNMNAKKLTESNILKIIILITKKVAKFTATKYNKI